MKAFLSHSGNYISLTHFTHVQYEMLTLNITVNPTYTTRTIIKHFKCDLNSVLKFKQPQI